MVRLGVKIKDVFVLEFSFISIEFLIIVSAVNVEKSMFAGDGDEEDTSMAEDVCPDLSHIIRSLDTPPPSS